MNQDNCVGTFYCAYTRFFLGDLERKKTFSTSKEMNPSLESKTKSPSLLERFGIKVKSILRHVPFVSSMDTYVTQWL